MILLLLPFVLAILAAILIPGLIVGLGLKALALFAGVLALLFAYRYFDRRYNRP